MRATMLQRKVTLRGYASVIDGKGEFYVVETVNCTRFTPGQYVTLLQMRELIADGVNVVVKRK